MALGWENPDAFNTYPDALADCRRILADEYIHFSQGSLAYDAGNPVHIWLLRLISEQERAIQARGAWDASVLFKDGKQFLPRADYLALENANPATASNYWYLSHQDVLRSLATLTAVPKPVEVVTNEVIKEVVVPATLSDAQRAAIDFAARYDASPYVRGDDALYKLDSIDVHVTVDDAVKRVVSEERVRDKFELVLRSHNIRLEEKSPAFLLVYCEGVWSQNAPLLTYTVSADLGQTVTIDRDGDLRHGLGTLWTCGSFGHAGSEVAEREILSSVDQMAERFANAFLKANRER
jgi:hypothetical protein